MFVYFAFGPWSYQTSVLYRAIHGRFEKGDVVADMKDLCFGCLVWSIVHEHMDASCKVGSSQSFVYQFLIPVDVDASF